MILILQLAGRSYKRAIINMLDILKSRMGKCEQVVYFRRNFFNSKI